MYPTCKNKVCGTAYVKYKIIKPQICQAKSAHHHCDWNHDNLKWHKNSQNQQTVHDIKAFLLILRAIE